jgi:hypothetical protein
MKPWKSLMQKNKRAGSAFEDGAKSGILALNFVQNSICELADKRQHR